MLCFQKYFPCNIPCSPEDSDINPHLKNVYIFILKLIHSKLRTTISLHGTEEYTY